MRNDFLAASVASAIAAILALQPGTAVAADLVVKTAGFAPKPLKTTQNFLRFVEAIDKEVPGVKIDYVGPSAIPGRKQPQALVRGVIGMVFTAPSRFAGIVPEIDAVIGTNKTFKELRAAGAIKALNEYMAKKAKAKLLALHGLGVGNYLYLTTKPKFGKNGLPDFTGLKLRTSATYRAFLNKLGATTISVPTPEVYTALERGVAQGLAWPAIDATAMGLQKVTKYVIEPGFFNAPTVTVISLETWNKLSKEQQAKLQQVADRVSEKQQQEVLDQHNAEFEGLKKAGLQIVNVPKPEAYKSLAFGLVWAQMEKRSKAGAAKLKPLFYKQ